LEEVNIFIARHGQTDYNRDRILQGRGVDAPLNDVGRQQAQLLASYLCAKNYDALYTSTMKRAIQTSQIIADACELPFVTYEELSEMDYGKYEGKQYSNVAHELDEVKESWDRGETDLQIEGGESPEDVLKRAKPTFLNIINNHPGENILMILHGRLIRILLAHFLKGDLKYMEDYQINNCELDYLTFRNGILTPEFLNNCEYLTSAHKQ